MTPTVFDALRDWWWFAGIIIAFLVWISKAVIKTNKRLEQIDRVKAHDADIQQLQKKVDIIEQNTSEIKDQMESQKRDNAIFHNSLLAIMDALQKQGCLEIADARKALRKHLVERGD